MSGKNKEDATKVWVSPCIVVFINVKPLEGFALITFSCHE